MLATLVGARLRCRTPMLFALAFIPQFLIGGLSGIMPATPPIDYQANDSFFVVAHFHYTLFIAALVISRRRKRLRTGPWRATPGGGTIAPARDWRGDRGFGLAFGWWITVCSAPFFVAAIVHEIYAQRKCVSPGQILNG
jgi:Cytochrome C and Quinol oxidase polypeptide I